MSDTGVSTPQQPVLPPVQRWSHALVTKPTRLLFLTAGALVLIAWIWLALMVAGSAHLSGDAASLGPAMGGIAAWLERTASAIVPESVLIWLAAICKPQSGLSADIGTFLVALSMWFAMAFAMMLPAAAPMLRTYSEIAETAAGKGTYAVPLHVLAAGYLTVWAGFALLAAALHVAIMSGGLVFSLGEPVGGAIGGGVLILAGAYQFSGLKEACLTKCRNPFATLFGRWSDRPSAVFRLGLQQGVYCLGCCWALMLVMFVVGAMNLVWMAFLALFAIAEKTGSDKVTSRVSGGILLACGGILLAVSVIQS